MKRINAVLALAAGLLLSALPAIAPARQEAPAPAIPYAQEAYETMTFDCSAAGGTEQLAFPVSASYPQQASEWRAKGYKGWSVEEARRAFEGLGADAAGTALSDKTWSEDTKGFYNDEGAYLSSFPGQLQYTSAEVQKGWYERATFALATDVFGDASHYAEGFGLDLEAALGEVYPQFADVLEAAERFLDENGLSVGKPVAIKYWTLEQMRENWRRGIVVEAPDDSECPLQAQDEALYVVYPTFFQGVRMMPFGVGTPGGIESCDTRIAVFMNTRQILSVESGANRFASLTEGEGGAVISPQAAWERYLALLEQYLFIPEGALDVEAMALQYTVRYKQKADDFDPDYELVPVWTIQLQDQSAVMIHAVTGEEVPW